MKHSLFFLTLLAACSLSAFENYKQAADSVEKNLREKKFKEAFADAEAAQKIAEPKQKADAVMLKAKVKERESDFKTAIALLETVTAIPEANNNQKLSALQQIATLYSRNLKKPVSAIPFWTQIYDNKDFHPGRRADAAMNIASNLPPGKAEEWIQKGISVEKLVGNDQGATLNRAGNIYLAQKQYAKADEMFGKVIAIDKLHHAQLRTARIGLTDSAIAQKNFEKVQTYFKDFEEVAHDVKLMNRFAELADEKGKTALSAEYRVKAFIKGPFYPKTVENSLPGLFTPAAKAKDWSIGEKTAKDLLAFFANPPEKSNAKLSPSQKFQLELLAAAFASKGEVKQFHAPKADLSKAQPQDIAQAYFDASKIFAIARINDLAAFLAARQPEVVPIYEVTLVDSAPSDVTAWLASDIYKDPAKRETRFSKYNEKAVSLLINDVNVVREEATANIGKAACSTSFFVTADPMGIYIYAENKEPKLDMIRAGLSYGGMLEMYIQPGFSEPYYQWMLYLANNKVDVINWMPDNPTFRSLKPYLKTSVAEISDGFGSVMYIPWTAFYDKLPKNGDEWALGVVPFVPAGAFTWGTGQVHELHRFGRIKFKNIDPYLSRIKKEIVRQAWGKFRADIGEIKIFWADEVKGDAAFHKILAEKLAPYEEMGKKISETGEIAEKDVEELFQKAVPIWNESVFFVDGLRHEFLQNKLMNP